jgi:biotin transport system substrate-specific component
MVFASLMAALIAMGAFLIIPIGPVPIVLQNLFVLLAGLLLGARWACASLGIYLLAGACGLPVFAGGGGGLGHLVGPRGGYLIGFFFAALVVGYISDRAKGRVWIEIAGMILGSLVIYGLGVPWLKSMLGLSFSKAVAVGMLPFLIGDAIKIAIAIPIARSLRPLMNKAGYHVSEEHHAERS